MKTISLLAFSAFLALSLVPGTTAAQTGKTQVGFMQVDGQNAFLNGQRVTADVPIRVYTGDHVSTGTRTSVRIGLVAEGYGGIIQLDQDTDPNLVIASRCIIMKILKGQALVNAKNICLGSGNLSGVTNSLVNLKTDGITTELTVVEGRMEIEQPSVASVAANQRYWAGPSGEYRQYDIDAAEAQRTVEWTQRYSFGRAASSGPSPVAVGTGVVVGAGILCALGILCDHEDKTWCCYMGPDESPLVGRMEQRECRQRGGTGHGSEGDARAACARSTSQPASDNTLICCYLPGASPVPVERGKCRNQGGEEVGTPDATTGTCNSSTQEAGD